MTDIEMKIFSVVAAVLIWTSLSGTAGDGGGVCRDLAGKIAGYAKEHGIAKMVVADFAAKAGAEKFEADYISEKLSGCLGAAGFPGLVDRDFLAAAAGSPYGQKQRGEPLSVDAVLSGTVFAGGDKVRVLVKLVDAKEGRLLFSAEAAARRDWAEPVAKRRSARGQAGSPAGGVPPLNPELPGGLISKMLARE